MSSDIVNIKDDEVASVIKNIKDIDSKTLKLLISAIDREMSESRNKKPSPVMVFNFKNR